MVQVDVFWSYGIGASFALAAAHQLRARAETGAERRPLPESGEPGGVVTDPFLTGAMLYCAALFAPSGAWLLWGFPNWETMQVGSHSMPAWLVAAFAMTNTTQGVAGYLLTRKLITAGRIRWAVLQAVAGYFSMFFILVHGWDGNGYKRFFSVDKADYRDWAARSALSNVAQWATSSVALTLYGMGVVLVPLMLAMMHRYHRQGLRAAGVRGPGGRTALAITLGTIFVGALGAAIATSLLIHLFTAVTGSIAPGWALGAIVAVPLLWSTMIRRNGLASAVARWLALPAEEQPASSAAPLPAAP
ncbi:hypothetical protein GCM10023196_004820 [Actinoallomurus vinaceus]|uniref:DUF418 domain-containing protein n=1 Tax=Actinoallomurus vinaceus TaxID=1080074 RepID=A0ABP8U429_9ACTN